MKKRSSWRFKLILSGLVLAGGCWRLPAQSLWKETTSTSMLTDKRAHAVGDILTIIIQESQTATKDNTTKTGRSTDLDASIATFLYSPAASGFLTKGGQMPAIKLNSKNNFSGGGQINNSEKIMAQVAVKVVDVLPNGNLVIEGTHQTAFSGETSDAVLRGTVRSEDIQSNNTVYSYNVANATIRYVSKGVVTDSQRKGWLMKVWDKIAPF
jgi:flagellar L-ring protein precursor FlgH